MTGPDLPPPYPQQPQQPQPGWEPAWQSQVPPAPRRRRGRLVLVAVVVLLGLVGGGVLAWTQLRGDGGDDLVYVAGSQVRAPEPAGSGPERAWEVEVPGSTYVVDSGDDRVVLQEEESVRALSLEDGSVEWETDLGELEVGPRFRTVPGEGMAVADRDMRRTRWISFEDGSVAWEVEGLVLAVDGETGVVRPEGGEELQVVDALTGEERWTFPREQSYGVAVAGDVLVTVDVDAVTVRGYDLEDGDELWTTELDEAEKVTAADGLAVVLGGDVATALGTSDGEEVWQGAAIDAARVAPDRVVVQDGEGSMTLLDPDGEVASTELEGPGGGVSSLSGGQVGGQWLVAAINAEGPVLLDEDLEEIAAGFAGFTVDGYYTRERDEMSFHDEVGGDPAWTADVPGARYLVDGGILTFGDDGDGDVLALYR